LSGQGRTGAGTGAAREFDERSRQFAGAAGEIGGWIASLEHSQDVARLESRADSPADRFLTIALHHLEDQAELRCDLLQRSRKCGGIGG